MALYVRLVVYTGLSLFIIRRANVYLVVCVLTRITLQLVGTVSSGTVHNLKPHTVVEFHIAEILWRTEG